MGGRAEMNAYIAILLYLFQKDVYDIGVYVYVYVYTKIYTLYEFQ